MKSKANGVLSPEQIEYLIEKSEDNIRVLEQNQEATAEPVKLAKEACDEAVRKAQEIFDKSTREVREAYEKQSAQFYGIQELIDKEKELLHSLKKLNPFIAPRGGKLKPRKQPRPSIRYGEKIVEILADTGRFMTVDEVINILIANDKEVMELARTWKKEGLTKKEIGKLNWYLANQARQWRLGLVWCRGKLGLPEWGYSDNSVDVIPNPDHEKDFDDDGMVKKFEEEFSEKE